MTNTPIVPELSTEIAHIKARLEALEQRIYTINMEPTKWKPPTSSPYDASRGLPYLKGRRR